MKEDNWHIPCFAGAMIKTPVHELPRQELEALARLALREAYQLRQQIAPNGLFNAVALGFGLGAAVATAGFLVGAAVR